MSKVVNKISFGFFSFALVLLASAASGAVTNSVPQIQAVYGGMLRAINVIPLTASPNVSRIFASTESANSVFYGDVDHSNPFPFATNVFSFHVVPDLSAAANFGTVNGIAGHPDSGKLFIADDAGLLSCSMASNTLVTNIVAQSAPPNPPGAGPISQVLIKDNVLLAIGDTGGSKTLHFGALDASGNFTKGSGSPVTIGVISFPQMVVHPVNRHVYIMGDSSTNINKSSAAIGSLSGATTFTAISLPLQASAWNTKRIGIGPDGRLFVGGNSGDPGAYKMIAYSNDDGTNWTIVGTGMQGTSGGNVETGADSNEYSVYFGSAVSTNKGATNSWASIPRDQSPPSQTHSNDGEVRVDPRNANVVYFTTDQGIGSTTNNCLRIFEIDNGLEAVQIQDFDMTADKNVAWTAAKSGIRRATNFQTSPQWSDAIFPLDDGSPYYSVAVDQSDPNGLTAYAGNARIYKTTDGGTNWVSVYYPGAGAESTIVCLEVNGNDVFAGRYANMFANIGGLIYSANGGTTWTNLALGGETNINVNDIILTEESGAGVTYVAAAYNTNNNTGGHVYRVTASGSTHVSLGSDPISARDLALDSSGGIYASGWTTDYNPVVFYKSAGSSTWTQLTTNGLPKPSSAGIGMAPAGRGPIITVGRDVSSNEIPILASGVTLYYLPSGGSEWVTSDELHYPDGTQLNVLYWDALLVGTDTGLYGQELGLQPGTTTAIPFAADLDGDGKADPIVYLESDGTWKVKISSGGYALLTLASFLGGSGYTALAADFDGDGKADPAVYQEATGTWLLKLSSAGYAVVAIPTFLGGSGYTALAGDFDGDAKADPAVYQEATGTWLIKLSGTDYSVTTLTGFLGGTNKTAFAADFDGDGKADPSVYDKASPGFRADYPASASNNRLTDPAMNKEAARTWEVKLSSADYSLITLASFLGASGWSALAADFDGDGLADPAVVQTSTGNWEIKLSSANYGKIILPGFLGE